MDYKELIEKYNILLEEINRLTKENSQLKAQLGLTRSELPRNTTSAIKTEKNRPDHESTDRNCFSNVDSTSDALSKIRLFMSLFKGRDDVYAKRWKNKSKGTSGYSPVCLNQWQPEVCGKPKISCSKCKYKLYAALDEDVIENHLRGNLVVGIYPMLPDETCCFLAMDFDEADWQKDISVLRDVCIEFNIPVAVERSRSGKGAHVWFFFENRLSAALARKFGTALLTYSMNRRHEIHFKSYDRLFPIQDIIAAKKEILIVSPFVRKRRTHQMIQHLKISTGNNVRVIVVTRPKEDFMAKDHGTLQRTLNLLTSNGVKIVFKSNIHQKFAVMDQKIVWYGSINLLSYGSAQESIMRIESSNIANELMKSIENA